MSLITLPLSMDVKTGRANKMKLIAALLGQNFDDLVADLYTNKKLSSNEIAEFFRKKINIAITPRSIQRTIKKLNIGRTKSRAFHLAMAKGRRTYAHLRKPVKSNELRHGLSLKVRYLIFQRDNYRCVICGKSAADGEILVVDHRVAVVNGGTNNPDNLRILCRSCNHGKMLTEEKYV